MSDMKRITLSGTAVTVRGNDIDTDRIIPARFLRCVTFEGIGAHAFEDDRAQLRKAGQAHPFDDPRFAGAHILFANKNFGCGSSREHAPQSLMRWNKGIKAIVGESFAEIFFGNCVALGIPCATVSEADINTLMGVNEKSPETVFTLDVEKGTVSYPGGSVAATIPAGPRSQFLEGRWDATGDLMAAREQIAAKAAQLPYFNHWR